jgi:Xaa-Pro aminopeptidase
MRSLANRFMEASVGPEELQRTRRAMRLRANGHQEGHARIADARDAFQVEQEGSLAFREQPLHLVTQSPICVVDQGTCSSNDGDVIRFADVDL